MKLTVIVIIFSLTVICIKPATASSSGLFGGISPPLVEQFDPSRQGVVLDIEFKVKNRCAYQFDIDFIHKNKQWNELKNLLRGGKSKKGISIPVHLTIDKQGSKEGKNVFDETVETSGASSHSSSTTNRTIGHTALEPGNYHAILKVISNTPELKGIDANFVIRVRPKTNCE